MSILISIFGRVLSHGTASNGLKIILGIVLFYTYKYRSNAVGSRRRFDLKEPKGAVPLLGHLPVLASMPFTEMCQFFEKQNNELGPVWSITLPGLGRPIQIDTPENLEHVLKTNFTNYGRGQLFKDITWELGGNSLFTSDGAQWKFQRHIGNGIFHVKAFQEYVSDALVVEGKKVLDILGKAADEGTIVDMQKLMLDYTIDVFGSISFGGSFGCLDNIEKKAPFVKAFEDMLEIFGNRLKDPTWKIREQPDGTRKRAESNKMFLRGHAQEIINKRRREGYSAAKKDLLQLLMEGRDDAGEPLPDDLIVDNIIAFTVAGRDTTAQALTWMFYSILRGCSDPEIIKNLVKEVDEVFDGSEPTHETYRKQKYAEACFYEASCLYPALPRNMRFCEKDNILPDGKRVYAGEWIAWSGYVMGRSELVWGPDAKEYKPSRWINTEKPSQTKFISFHAGPRVCLGKQFATIEACTIIGMMLQSFDLILEDPSRVAEYKLSILFPMADGLNMRVSRRSRAL